MGPRSFSRNYFDKNTNTNDFEAQSLSEITAQATKIQVNDNTKSSNLKQIADVLKSKFHEILLFVIAVPFYVQLNEWKKWKKLFISYYISTHL